MTALFLSPHNDDETLFGAYTLIRERPHVIVCLRSQVQEDRGTGITAARREAETDAAMDVLGCEWTQWDFPDNSAWTENHVPLVLWEDHWGVIDHVYAPAIEDGGHPHHNAIGAMANHAFGDRVTHYTTYTNGRDRTVGSRPVVPEPEWVLLKLQALACYRSQILEPSTGHHFARALDEWYK